ncbi:hydantoinase/oxoprolinase family protein [Methanimicrococcus blatticola]|uniref:N-methylhydantoinase A/oxoprolinase/acetone carboxylase beta subunit n=1 Tax=Methanimicrococcus blatticola TaxID=91560 RepID=A0A484F2N9_9EURY|nr:hydantoinase/oxoprolinase family protein [Methanimicrococcus blatticola]MBZ3936392.1 hydantoinase/oxoprolinase family protein [Methanimicrococcus blatticola]MCC2509554.1 hydantoinase/oxoprolinase family protein [Methanimicrococcus blatticola]TDQ67606.1 N-methylhydantoinase A/oxoprolinase/acetone carboxylase beta subunit [Methanimicrococcus blatticola]
MKLGLGIDTGGTYTDAVLMDLETGAIIEKSKSLTTHSDLVVGITKSIEGLSEAYFKEIKFTSVSTTLATNTTLEGKGYPCGLILVGYSISGDLPVSDVLEIRGGHDADGNELDDPMKDLEVLQEFIESTQNSVASYAVSSFFSVRNPEHEFLIKEKIAEMTDLPIVCGHELSRALGVYERTLTAVLNAQLIPVTNQFVRSVLSVMEDKNIDSDLMIMKCDGSLVNIEEALLRPVESIFSGPAASLVGASHLTGDKTCVTIDVGGTSTDISMIIDGIPNISDTGATVGGWKTMVRAIQMNTSALGGDSHVWACQGLQVGPRRVIPLSLAAVEYPGLVDKMKTMDLPSERVLDQVIQGTAFFSKLPVSSRLSDISLSPYEQKVLDAVSDVHETPSTVYEISNRLGDHPLMFTKVLDSLVLKRCVSQIGFTPTDALHVLDKYVKWDTEAARLGAKILADYLTLSPEEFSRRVQLSVSEKMATDLISFFAPYLKPEDVSNLVLKSPFAKFKITTPVILIGAPVRAYSEDFGNLLDAEVILPDFYDVGNAVGALVGDVIFRTNVLIRPKSLGSLTYIAFDETGRREYESDEEAVSKSEDKIRELIYAHMEKYGLHASSVKIEIKREDIQAGFSTEHPLEIKLFGIGVGTPRKIDSDSQKRPELTASAESLNL